jgi:hypothetical protein
METKDRLSRIAPLCGVFFVVLEIAGVIVGSAGGRSMAALGDPTSKIVKSFSDPIGTGVWVGAYLELVSLVPFALFAIWMFRGRRGPLATAGVVVAAVYVATTIAALVAGDVVAYGQSHGLGDQALLTLFYLQSGLFFATWGIAALFLLVAPVAGWLRYSAVAIAALLLVALAFPTGGASQFPNLMFLIWVLAASIKMARRTATAPAPAAVGIAAT